MADRSKIEWCTASWSPVVGCSLVSRGCTNCYAMRMAERLEAMGQAKYAGLTRRSGCRAVWTGTARLHEPSLSLPFRWKAPRRIFVNPMSDLFHEALTDGEIMRVFDVMFRTPWHTHLVLTKRPERALDWLRKWADTAEESDEPMGLKARSPDDVRRIFRSGRAHLFAGMLDTMGEPPAGHTWPPYDWIEGHRWRPTVPPTGHIWIGFSAEDQPTFDARWANARQWAAMGWPAWVSMEPLLGPVELQTAPVGAQPDHGMPRANPEEWDDWKYWTARGNGLAWCVAGGESGPGARPIHPDWARSLRDQCAASGIPYLWKQWGAWRPPAPGERFDTLAGLAGRPPAYLVARDGTCHCTREPAGEGAAVMVRVGKHAAGREIDGTVHDGYPEARHG